MESILSETPLIDMPKLVFGTVQSNLAIRLKKALDHNYRHIDCADAYSENYSRGSSSYVGNYFEIISNIIKQIPRNQLWITWKSNNISIENIRSIIRKLDCTYIDLFLIHHSCGNDSDFVVFKQAVDENLIRFYGVSNCEDIGILTDLKTKHNIFANQIQARSPNGSIDRRMRFPPDFNFFDFVNKCNSIGICIMLFASVSGIFNSISYEDMSLLERIPNLVRLTNPYYMHKFLFNQQIRVPDDFSTNPIIMIKHLLRFMKDINVSNHSISNSLIVSSSNLRSTTLLENMTHFEQISRGENLLSYSEFIEIEDFLESHQLALM